MVKKTGSVVVGIVLVLLIGIAAIAVLAVRGTFIGKDEAERIAYKDAGIEAPYSRTELKFKDGHFRYDVAFYVNGIEYEYSILAKDGTLLFRNTKGSGAMVKDPAVTEAPAETTAPETTVPETEPETTAPETTEAQTTPPETTAPETEATAETTADTPAAPNTPDDQSADEVDPAKLEHAEIIALSNMGLMDRQADVEFTDEKWSKEGDKIIFELTFCLDDTEYYCKVSEHGEMLDSDSKPKN